MQGYVPMLLDSLFGPRTTNFIFNDSRGGWICSHGKRPDGLLAVALRGVGSSNNYNNNNNNNTVIQVRGWVRRGARPCRAVRGERVRWGWAGLSRPLATLPPSTPRRHMKCNEAKTDRGVSLCRSAAVWQSVRHNWRSGGWSVGCWLDSASCCFGPLVPG